MKIGLMSDTHGRHKAIDAALKLSGKVDLWLHAGDYVDDADYLAHKSGIETIFVAGNGDWNSSVPADKYLEIAGKKIFITHGHNYGVKSGLGVLRQAALQKECDCVIFGHSHVYCEAQIDGILFLNPGSVSFPRDGQSGTFAVLEIAEDGRMKVDKYTV